jgi:hypothetical protein
MNFNSRSKAAEYAKAQSILNPGLGYFVNWVEDYDWSVDIEGEFDDQEFYMNGQLVYPEWEDD